jgi:hypothetical protein
MNKVVETTDGRKREPYVNPVSPGAVSRLGAVVGVGTPEKHLYYNKVAASNPVGPTNNFTVGVAGGRTVLPSGSQSKTPRVSDPPRGKNHW